MYDEDTKPFYKLCDEHGDKEFCDHWIYKASNAPLFHTSFLADEITEIEVITRGQWDENHPAGSSLNDLIHFVGISVQPFIDANYEMFDYDTHQASEFFYSIYPWRGSFGPREWYPIDKPLKELTQDDMHLWGLGHPGVVIDSAAYHGDFSAFLASLILPVHDGDTPVEVELTLTDSVGETYTSEIVI